MTDNRTNEPSDAQVEAAAKAIADNLFPNWTLFSRARASKDMGSLIHVAARAALVAAQGAAPQAESEYYLRPSTHPRRSELVAVIDAEAGSYDPITTGCGYHESLKLADGSDMAERIADKVILAGLAPVLPSSTESPVEPFKTWFACWWKNEPNAIAESNAQSAFYAGWDARGLPSSGVDVDALAEVRREAAEKAWREGELAGTRNQRDFHLYQQGKITETEYERRVNERANPYRAEAYRQERGEQ